MRRFLRYVPFLSLAITFACSILKPELAPVVATASLDLADTTLASLTPFQRDLIFRHCCASAAWRVTRFGERPGLRGTEAALKRARSERGYETTLHGYVSNHGGGDYSQTRVMLRFGEYEKGSEDGWIRDGQHDRGDAGGNATVRVFESRGYKGASTSYVVIRGDGVWLEVFEDSLVQERRATPRAFEDVCAEAKALLTSPQARERGFDAALLPEGSTRTGAPPTMAVDDGFQPGIYMVSGYVNAGEKGNVYFRVFNAQTSEEVLLEGERARTVEYVGWSDDEAETFFFQGEAMCKVGDWEHEYPARFELWFEPAAGGPHRLLMTSERKIYGWQR